MRRTWTLLAALVASTPAVAQPDPGRPRTGPDAAVSTIPPFATPGPAPLLAPPDTSQTPIVTPETGPPVEIRIVDDGQGEARDAVPPPGWQPGAQGQASPGLAHRPGEPLDAAWVRRQFAAQPDIGAAGAIALIQLINRAFLSAGFVNSGLLVEPGSDPALLTIRLIHGRLVGSQGDAISVGFAPGGNRGLHPDYVRDRFPSASRRPLNAGAIERDFRLLTEDPALRTVTAQLRPGARPGEASLAVIVLPRERADFYLSAGNSRSPTVGGERAAIGGYVRNIAGSGDLLSAEGGMTRGVFDASFSYATPFLAPSTSLNLRGSYNEAAVVDTPLLALDIETRDVAGQIGISHELLRAPLTPAGEGIWSPSRSLAAGMAVGYRRQNSFLLGLPFSFAPGSVDGRAEYAAVRLLGDYVVRNVDQVFAASLTATVGLAGTRSDQPLTVSPDRHFLSLLMQLNYARRLTASGLELRGRLTGQWANSVLYSGERLGIGGEASVRGYRESVLLADRGAVGSVELALPFSLSGEAGARRRFDWGAFTIAAFADAAYADNVDGPEPEADFVASAGLALAWQPSDAVQLRVSWGHAFVDIAQAGTRDIQDDGIHLRFTLYPLRLLRP